MTKKVLYMATFVIVLAVQSSGLGAEKFNLGAGYKWEPTFYLPVFAAEEKGIWKENGLEVEWVPFAGGSAMYQGLAAASVNMGSAGSTTHLLAASGGVPAVIVATLVTKMEWPLFVRPDSPMKEPKDLKGKKIGVGRFAASPHIYGRVAMKALGLEKDVRFVQTGGMMEELAALSTGSVDAVIDSLGAVAGLLAKGEVRRLMSVSEYLPKDWVDQVVGARKDFLKSKADTAKRVLKALFQAVDFVDKNPEWAIARMMAFQNYPDATARLMYKEGLNFSKDGKITRSAVENIRNIMIEYGVITKERAPSVGELYTEEYLPR